MTTVLSSFRCLRILSTRSGSNFADSVRKITKTNLNESVNRNRANQAVGNNKAIAANLQQYEEQGWVPQMTYDITSYPYTVGGSETLEYALDDFSISQLAAALGEKSESATFAKRAQNWQNLFDPSTGYLAARTSDGSFPPGPAFQLASAADQLQGIAQEGFEEGNAVQYTWVVPQNLAGLIGLMGGDQATVAKLNTFFKQLNAHALQPVRLGRERARDVGAVHLRLCR